MILRGVITYRCKIVPSPGELGKYSYITCKVNVTGSDGCNKLKMYTTKQEEVTLKKEGHSQN